MTALPNAPQQAQLSLFEQPRKAVPKPKTAICSICHNERAIGQFRWESKGVRSDVCNTCRMSPPSTNAKPAASGSARLAVINMPVLPMPQPAPLWAAKKGDTFNLILNNEMTGQTLFCSVTVEGAKQTSKLSRCYTRLRNLLVSQGWQIGQIRASVTASLMQQAVQGGQ